MQLLLTMSFFLAAVQAANIRNHSGRNCQGNYRVCTNIAQNRCCYHAGVVFKSSYFSYLADTSFGLTCTGTAKVPCQTVRAAKHAGGCVQPVGSTTRLRGSYWFDCHNRVCPRETSGKAVEFAEVAEATERVLADKCVIDGHVFEINYNVPAYDTKRIEDYADSGARYESIPAGLKKYEVHGDIAKAVLGE